MNDESPSRRLSSLIWPGALASQAIYVAANLGIADLIEDEPKAVDELALEAGCDPEALLRVIRALASLGVFAETTEGLVEHTPTSRTLRRDHPQTVRAWGVFLGSPWLWQPWGELLHTVRTGENGFKKVFGVNFDRYMAEHPHDAEVYNNAMSAGAAMFAELCVAAYDFSEFTRIVDLGGGCGGLLAAILKANPSARGVLFDLPPVAQQAAQLTDGLTKGELAGRCEVKGGDFFDAQAVPQDGDLYILKGVLHGFPDDEAAKILENCRRAIRPSGRLLTIETLPQGAQEPNPQKAFMDLLMMSIGSGRERSAEELSDLFRQSNFAVVRVLPTSASNSIVEARPI